MEKESNDSSITSASSSTASSRVLASSEIKQEEDDDDRTLQYKRNLNNILDKYTERYEELPKGRQKLVDKMFHEKFQGLVRFHHQHGHWKVPSTERRLYGFLTTLHRIYRCAYYDGECCETNIFPRHRYEKMVAIGYPFEDITIQETTLEEEDDISTTSSSDSRASTSSSGKVKEEEEEDRTLDYQSNLEKVLDEYTERYEAQPAKCQRRYDDIFDKHVQALVDFHRYFEHWRVPPSLTGLYGWTVKINSMYRCAYFEGKCYNSYILPRHRYEKLLAIGYPFNEETGDVTNSLCSSRSSSDEDEELMEYQRNLDKVLNTYTKRYEKIPKKSQKLHDKKFDAHIETLVDFHKKYGHWKVPRTQEHSSLHTWVENIHRIFRCAYYDGKCCKRHCGILTKHRYGKLVVIGFPFELEEIENKEEESEEEEGVEDLEGCERKLNKVIDQYTKRYKKSSKNIKAYYDGLFDLKLKSLVEFHCKFGHWKVPRDESIHTWLQGIHRTYEKAYFKGEQNGTCVLPRHRYEKLVAIGYPFQEFLEDGTPENDDDSPITEITDTVPALVPQSAAAYSITCSTDSNSQSSKRNIESMPKTRNNAYMKSAEKSTSTKDATATIQTVSKRIQTNTANRNEVQTLQSKILQLERENESHYDTIYRLKDEKESLLEQVEELNKQLEMLKVYKRKELAFEIDNVESTSSQVDKESESQKATISHLEKESKANYDTIHRLKDEKESLVIKVKEQNNELIALKRKLDEYMDRDQSSEHDNIGPSLLSSKRQRTSSESSNTDIERLQQERQLLIDQLTSSTENYRKLLDLVPRHNPT